MMGRAASIVGLLVSRLSLPVWESPSIKERLAEMADERNSLDARNVAVAAGCMSQFNTVDEARDLISESLRAYGIDEKVDVRFAGDDPIGVWASAYCWQGAGRVGIVFTNGSGLYEATVLHEVAHAICYLRGLVNDHGEAWRGVYFDLLEWAGYRPRDVDPAEARDLAREALLATVRSAVWYRMNG